MRRLSLLIPLVFAPLSLRAEDVNWAQRYVSVEAYGQAAIRLKRDGNAYRVTGFCSGAIPTPWIKGTYDAKRNRLTARKIFGGAYAGGSNKVTGHWDKEQQRFVLEFDSGDALVTIRFRRQWDCGATINPPRKAKRA